jgi:hypothetical protein
MTIYKQYYTRKTLVYILLWFLLTGYSFRASAEEASKETIRIVPEEEMPLILNLIANQTRDNYERIVTWSGEIDVKTSWLWTGAKAEDFFKRFTHAKGDVPESILQKAEEKITFAIDTKKNFVYVDQFREKNQYLNHITGIDLGRKSTYPICSTLIARPDFLLEAKPQSFKDNKIIHSRAIKKASIQDLATGLYQGFNDPRKTFVRGGIFTWDSFDKLVKNIDKFSIVDGYSLKMEEHQKGEVIKYNIIQPFIVNLERSDPNHYLILTKIFSSQYGFNMIYWEATSGGGIPLQKFTWEYELINGVNLPKRVVEKHYALSGEVALEKESTYVNNKLNQKIPSETFEYTNLKLKEGDIFIDEILNKEYRYKASTQTLQPVEK